MFELVSAVIVVAVCLFWVWIIIDVLAKVRTDLAVDVVKKNNLAATADLAKSYECEIEKIRNECSTEIETLQQKHKNQLAEISKLQMEQQEEVAARSQKIGYKEGFRQGVIESHIIPMRPAGGYAKRTPEYLAAMEEVNRLNHEAAAKKKAEPKAVKEKVC